MTRSKQKVAPIFTRVRDFISRYSVIDPDDLNLVTVWTIGTWTFSPMTIWPATFPYLYITGPTGSGKTTLGKDVLGATSRQHRSATGATGAALFRMLGRYDPETGEVESYAPTLFLDEIDMTFSGAKDPDLTQMLDVGYADGNTIPRAAGKTSIEFPVYGPKLLLGIDNGHLPVTVANRSIRIDVPRLTSDQLGAAGVEEFYPWDVRDEKAELQAQCAEWAKENSLVLRDYRPARIPGLSGRQWQIARSIVQLAHALGNEAQIVKSLTTNLNRNPERPDHKVELYTSIWGLFTETNLDRLTTAQVLSKLTQDGVRVPGQSGKGLAAVLSEDGVPSGLIRLPKDHPEHKRLTDAGKQPVQRGYFRHHFDGPFHRFLPEDEEL